ncbi:MAG TPA: four helix bundle protein [Terriglobales bacterium]|nr:four helix bundle protein [Terriglobales bacterium]
MPSRQEEFRNRTKRFAFRIIHLFQALPGTTAAQILGKQLLRSGTSVAANYRAVGRARSRAEFIAQLGVVIEEADETAFWLECLIESRILPSERLQSLLKEADELVAIFAAAERTARANSGKKVPGSFT